MDVSSISFTGKTRKLRPGKRNLGSKKFPLDRPAKIANYRNIYKKKIMQTSVQSKEILQDVITLSQDSKQAKTALKNLVLLT